LRPDVAKLLRVRPYEAISRQRDLVVATEDRDDLAIHPLALEANLHPVVELVHAVGVIFRVGAAESAHLVGIILPDVRAGLCVGVIGIPFIARTLALAQPNRVLTWTLSPTLNPPGPAPCVACFGAAGTAALA